MRSSDILISRRRYTNGCQFGLVNLLENQTGFLKFLNVTSLLFLAPVVVLVLVTVIPYVYLLLTRTLVPVTTISFHVTFDIFNGISSLFVKGLFPIVSPRFSTCRNFQHSP